MKQFCTDGWEGTFNKTICMFNLFDWHSHKWFIMDLVIKEHPIGIDLELREFYDE